MWAKPMILWMVDAGFAGGWLYTLWCDDRVYQIAVMVLLLILRALWTRLLIRAACDAKLQAVFDLARRRS